MKMAFVMEMMQQIRPFLPQLEQIRPFLPQLARRLGQCLAGQCPLSLPLSIKNRFFKNRFFKTVARHADRPRRIKSIYVN